MKLFKKQNNDALNNQKLISEIESLKRFCEQQYRVIDIVYSNSQILDLILSNTIKNEDGEDTCTIKFKDIKSFTTYVKAMNDITIQYLKERI